MKKQTKSGNIDYRLAQTIYQLAKDQLSLSRKYKEQRWYSTWLQINEDRMLANNLTADGIEHIHTAMTSAYIRTYLSKIDNPRTFRYEGKTEIQKLKAPFLNALKEQDEDNRGWRDVRLQAYDDMLMYSVGVVYLHCNKAPYYQEIFNINPLNFYFDPYQNSLKDTSGTFTGSFDIKLTKAQVDENQNSGYFYSKKSLTVGEQSLSEDMYEQTMKEQITRDVVRAEKQKDQFELYRWFTWKDGVQYYLEFDDHNVYTCRRCKDFFGYEKDPYVIYSTRKSAYRLYSISPVMEQIQMFQTQERLLSYAIENVEQAIDPIRYINRLVVPDAPSLRHRKGIDVTVSTAGDINNAIMHQKPGEIQAGFEAFNLIGQIQQNQSGVGPGLRGLADEDKVGIYDGNIEQAADLFGLDDKMLESAERKLAWLYEKNVRFNLDEETSVRLLGADKAMSQIMITSKNIKDEHEYPVQIIASSSEDQSSSKTQANKLQAIKDVIPLIQTMPVVAEAMLKLVGFEEQEIKDIMEVDQTKTVSDYRAKVDLALLLTGSKPIFKRYADMAYLQTIESFMRQNEEFLKIKDLKVISMHIEMVYQYFMENEATKAEDTLATQQEMQMDAMNQQVDAQGNPIAGDPNKTSMGGMVNTPLPPVAPQTPTKQTATLMSTAPSMPAKNNPVDQLATMVK